jgi:hypothetical protein
VIFITYRKPVPTQSASPITLQVFPLRSLTRSRLLRRLLSPSASPARTILSSDSHLYTSIEPSRLDSESESLASSNEPGRLLLIDTSAILLSPLYRRLLAPPRSFLALPRFFLASLLSSPYTLRTRGPTAVALLSPCDPHVRTKGLRVWGLVG